MIDLETLGTDPAKAPVFQVAIVPFHLKGVGPAKGRVFNQFVQPSTCFGRTVDFDTLHWWLDTNPTLFATLMAKARIGVSMRSALEGMTGYFAAHDGPIDGVWGNGPAFDNAIIAALCREAGVPLPWPFYLDRCVRTKKADAPNLNYREIGEKVDGAAHDALVDCYRQILHVQTAHRAIQGIADATD